MDVAILEQLNVPLVDQALNVWAKVAALQADLDAIIVRLTDVNAFLQDIQSGSGSASQNAQEQLRAFVDLGEVFVGSTVNLYTLLGIDANAINARLAVVRNGLANLSSLNAAAIQALDAVATVYERLERMQGSGGELALARAAFTDYVSKWLNQEFVFPNNGSPITVRFTSNLGDQFPFGANANLAAVVTLKGIAATVENVRLKVDPGSQKVNLDFESATFSTNFDINSFAQEIIGELSFDLPGGVTLDNPVPHLDESPPSITVDGGVQGIPGFDALSFTAKLRIATDKISIEDASGGIGSLIVPILPGVLAMKGFTVGFQPAPLAGFDPPLEVPALQIGTAINPMEGGDATGAMMSFDVKNIDAGNGIFFPLKDFGKTFSYRGTLVLLNSFECGKVQGSFAISPPKFTAHIEIGYTGQSSPFGSGDIFSLEADATIEESGMVFSGSATYFRFIEGNVNGNISFSGGGHVTANADANITILAAKATFSADWDTGFANFEVMATASVTVPIKGFSAPVVSAQIVCTGNDQTKKILVSAEILGFPILKQPLLNTSQDLGKSLASLVKLPDLNEIAKQLFERGKALLEAFGGIDNNPFLARALGSLEPFAEFANAVPEAKELFKQADKAIEDTRKQVEERLGNASNVVKETIKKVGSVARNVGKSVGIGLLGGSGGIGIGFPTDLPSDFIDDIKDLLDDLFDQAELTNAAKTLAEQLGEETIHEEEQGRASGSDARVDSRLDVRFDQIILGAEGVEPETGIAKSSYVAFYLTGGSSTRRRRQTVNASFANWGVVNFIDSSTHGLMANIDLKIDEQPLADASLLHAKHKIYNRLRSLIVAVNPGINFGTDTNPNGDPNDPGAEPSVDLNFGQPPTRELPVLGSLGVDRVAVDPNGGGARIIRLSPGGAADAAGLLVDDVITKINGTPITSVAVLSSQVTTSLLRKLKLDVKLDATLANTVINVKLDPISLTN